MVSVLVLYGARLNIPIFPLEADVLRACQTLDPSAGCLDEVIQATTEDAQGQLTTIMQKKGLVIAKAFGPHLSASFFTQHGSRWASQRTGPTGSPIRKSGCFLASIP